MSYNNNEAVLGPFDETVDYEDADDDTDAHPRHRHDGEESDTAPLTGHATAEHIQGTLTDSDPNETSDNNATEPKLSLGRDQHVSKNNTDSVTVPSTARLTQSDEEYLAYLYQTKATWNESVKARLRILTATDQDPKTDPERRDISKQAKKVARAIKLYKRTMASSKTSTSVVQKATKDSLTMVTDI
ncbi:hypothetical protein CPB97_002062 [Podila verticillata]|nr:hypothetical protein CPB97_002062 [Podila verticillata]